MTGIAGCCARRRAATPQRRLEQRTRRAVSFDHLVGDGHKLAVRRTSVWRLDHQLERCRLLNRSRLVGTLRMRPRRCLDRERDYGLLRS